jgi:hypothetical protein
MKASAGKIFFLEAFLFAVQKINVKDFSQRYELHSVTKGENMRRVEVIVVKP